MTDLKALTDEIEAAREALLGAFDAQGFATGHGDTLADLVMEFSIQSQDRAEAAEARAARAETENARLRSALEDVADPMRALRRDAEAQGRQLSGMAYSIANDLGYVKSIASSTLSEKA